MKAKRPRLTAVAAGLVAGLLGWCVASEATTQTIVVSNSNTSGTVTNVSTFVTNLGGNAGAALGFAGGSVVTVAETGALPATGGALEAAELEEIPNFSAGLPVEAAHATIIGQGTIMASEAAAANINVTAPCQRFFLFGGGATTNTIAADFVMSRASTTCSTNGPTTSGQSEVDGLVINGQPVTVTGEPNQMIWLSGGGFVVVNEQITGQTASNADIMVNALHVVAPCAGVEVAFGSSIAGPPR